MKAVKILVLGQGMDVDFISEVLLRLSKDTDLHEKTEALLLDDGSMFAFETRWRTENGVKVPYRVPVPMEPNIMKSSFNVIIVGESMIDKINLNLMVEDPDKKLILLARSMPPTMQGKPIEFVFTNYKSYIKAVFAMEQVLSRVA